MVATFNKPKESAVREFRTFYDNLYRSQSAKEAVDVMNRFVHDDQQFRYINSEAVFLQLTNEFRKVHDSEASRKKTIMDDVLFYRLTSMGKQNPRSDQELFDLQEEAWQGLMLGVYQEMRSRFMGVISDDDSVAAYEALGTNKALLAYYDGLN